MKKLIIPITILLASCGPSLEEKQSNIARTIVNHKAIEVKTIDSCEYIIIDGFESTAIVHKQNCKYCKTRK